jgi:hypothetical protein
MLVTLTGIRERVALLIRCGQYNITTRKNGNPNLRPNLCPSEKGKEYVSRHMPGMFTVAGRRMAVDVRHGSYGATFPARCFGYEAGKFFLDKECGLQY